MPKNGQSHPQLRLIHLPLSARYALDGMALLAQRAGPGYIRAEEAARRHGLPVQFLVKVFGRLVRKGLLESRRGRGGGFVLARDPRRIRVADIVAAVGEPGHGARKCLLGLSPCGRNNPCPAHEAMVRVDETLRERLENISLARLAGLGD